MAEVAPQTHYAGNGKGGRMPFKKSGSGTYTSPSGKKYTKKQVRLYYATKGFTKPPKRSS